MPCYQSTNLPGGVTTTNRTSFRTEAECLNACKEGACCEGTTCSVKPQCQCQGAGKVFKGVGTTCASQNGACCEDGPDGSPPTCSIKNECECVGNGKKFIGVGTTCARVNCCLSCQLFNCLAPACIPRYITVSYSASMPEHYSLEVGAYCEGFSISGTVTTSVIINEVNVSCGRYVFSGSAESLGGFNVQVIGERGFCVVTVKRGFTLLGYRDYPDGRGGVQLQPYGASSPTPLASGRSVTIAFPVTTGIGPAFLGGEASGYCYRSGTSQLGITYFPSHRLPGEFGVVNPVPAVNDAPCGSLSVISVYGSARF